MINTLVHEIIYQTELFQILIRILFKNGYIWVVSKKFKLVQI